MQDERLTDLTPTFDSLFIRTNAHINCVSRHIPAILKTDIVILQKY